MQPAPTPSPARALAEAYLRLGAEMDSGADSPARPSTFGDVAAEYEALRAACAVAHAPPADVLELTGEDRVRFLNGLTTCEMTSLASGAGRYGFLTDVKGRVLADVTIRAMPDRLRLLLPAGAAERVAGHLGRYIIADRVEVARRPVEAGVLLAGPAAESCLERAGEPEAPAAAGEHRALAGAPGVTLAAVAAWGVPAWELRGDAGALVEPLEKLVAAGARPAGNLALEAWRIEQGRLRFGVDYGSDNFPQESGFEEAVSYTKGCYLGQEIVARIHYRGQVNRLPRGLLLPAGGESAVGRALRSEGREAGRLTSAAVSPRFERPIGLALVHRRAAEPGARLEIEGGGEARVVALPITDVGIDPV